MKPSTLYEFSENTRKALLRAMKGRKRTQAFFDKSVTKWIRPTLFYTMSIQAMEEILYELEMANIPTADIRRELRGPGYHANHPKINTTHFTMVVPQTDAHDQSTGPAGCNFDPNPRCLKCTRCGNDYCNGDKS